MTAPARGRFLTLEGIEGVGKTTNADFIVRTLAENGRDVLLTREPGGTELAEAIRALALAPRDEAVEPLTEVLLMFAARRQHVARVIGPALAAGQWVVCDRFTDATLAYQGYGRGFPIAQIRTLADWAHADSWPDTTFLFDAPVSVSVERRRQRAGVVDRFEREQVTFFERVRAGYLEIAAAAPERVQVLDAAQPLGGVQAAIAARLAPWLREPSP